VSTSRLRADLRHRAAQALADLLDRVLGGAPAQRLEARLAGGVLQRALSYNQAK
jgi:hypothetical protein